MAGWTCSKCGSVNSPDHADYNALRCSGCRAPRTAVVAGAFAAIAVVFAALMGGIYWVMQGPERDAQSAMQAALVETLARNLCQAQKYLEGDKSAIESVRAAVLKDAKVAELLQSAQLDERGVGLFDSARAVVKEAGLLKDCEKRVQLLQTLPAEWQPRLLEAVNALDDEKRCAVLKETAAADEFLETWISEPATASLRTDGLGEECFRSIAQEAYRLALGEANVCPKEEPVSELTETQRMAISQHVKQAIMYAKLAKPEWENALLELDNAAAIDVKQEHVDIYLNRGTINIQRPDPQYVSAEEDLSLALAAPMATLQQKGVCHFNLAVLYARTLRNQEALQHLKDAVGLGFAKRDDVEKELGKFEGIASNEQYKQLLAQLPPKAN